MANAGWPQPLTVTEATVDETTVLNTRGVLNDSTYHALRDKIIGAALEEPRAVVVDVSNLTVLSESVWLAFTSAYWYVDRWPGTPIILVCRHAEGRNAISSSGIARYVPVFPTVDQAVDAAPHTATPRRRARAELPATADSLARSRELMEEWLTAWSMRELIPVTKVVATALVENVLQHTHSRPRIRLENNGAAVTVAVEDASHAPAEVREARTPGEAPSGLKIVAVLCRMWGNAPTPAGKAVWATIGPENRL